MIKTLVQLIEQLMPSFAGGWVFFIFPVVAIVLDVFLAYMQGGWWGLMATVLGFVAGLLLVKATLWSIGLLIVASLIIRMAEKQEHAAAITP
ncbi:MAG: hypothetical protein Q7R96_03355 [Nanoarchaeota archaeon]|nr:hypothetical protein [Nanoarchaeota archaeon]